MQSVTITGIKYESEGILITMAKHLTEKIVALLGGLLGLRFGKEIIVFLISMMPVLELRGGLIAASLLRLPPWKSYIICIIGNLIPIPLILWLIKSVLHRMEKSSVSFFKAFAKWLHQKVQKNKKGIETYGFWGLVFFVGIPLPGTGAWTGSMIAAVLDMDRKKTFFAVFLGVFFASIIMMLISFGLLARFLH